jgi:hypothetical protein
MDARKSDGVKINKCFDTCCGTGLLRGATHEQVMGRQDGKVDWLDDDRIVLVRTTRPVPNCPPSLPRVFRCPTVMKKTIKRIVKSACALVPSSLYDRASGLSVTRAMRNRIDAPVYSSREELWENLLKEVIGERKRILVLEFGVCEGYSIKYLATLNQNPDSLFLGFDSFEGLPEDWLFTHPKGTFSTRGEIPTTIDPRMKFVKGWFQISLPEFVRTFSEEEKRKFIPLVHFDADLYSSTLFLLTSLHWLFQEYFFIFDEFFGEELRAFHNYNQAYGVSVQFLGRTIQEKFINQVSGALLTRRSKGKRVG